MIEVKKFSGVLDMDNAPSEVASHAHIDARNVVFRGDGVNMRIQNMQGTTLITNSVLPSTGTHKQIGKLYDEVRQRIYFLLWNSAGKHGLYFYDIKTNTISAVFVCSTHSASDILQFDLNRPIEAMNILYGDDDILFFLDSLKRPSQIDITKYIQTPPTNVTRQDINVIKNPPTRPPTVVYANDNTVTVNNLRKNLFQFAYRLSYSQYNKSVYSSYSSLPLPTGTLDPVIDVDPTKNSRIDITVQTGSSDVQLIEIFLRKNLGKQYSKFYALVTLDKTKLGIGNNTTYTFPFFNDGSYVFADEKESLQLYDEVPDEANDQELLDGNVLIYGGIKEGLDRSIIPNIAVTSTAVANNNPTSSVASWAYNSRFVIGANYFKDEGKTNGVFVDLSTLLQTASYAEASGDTLVPQVNISIYHRPPIWATYYQLVRSVNSTKTSIIEFVTNATFKDDKYAYLSLETLSKYKTDNPNVGDNLNYEFANGDRIVIYKSVPHGVTGLVFTNKDYEIIGVVSDPLLSDGVKNGTFVKINLPTTLTSDFNFGTLGGLSWNNYLVEIYTPVKTTKDTLTTPFFEFGKCYGIGNAGQATRYHLGQIQNQAPDLSLPATFAFLDGDVYARKRTLTIGNILNYTIEGRSYGNDWVFLGITFNGQSYVDSSYTPQNEPAANIYGLTGSTNGFLRVGSVAKSFRFQGTLNFNVSEDNSVVYCFISLGFYNIPPLETNTTPRVYLFSPQSFSKGDHTLKVDLTINVPANTTLFMPQCLPLPSGARITWTPTNFTLSENVVYSQYIQDNNFSDDFLSQVNSNGRALLIDESKKPTYNSALLRWSLAAQQGTNVNQINRFYADNFDEVDRSKGDIQRLKVRERILRVFQNRGVGRHGVYAKFISQQGGQKSLITTEDIITANNIDYYSGDFGLGDQYTGLVSETTNDYGTDPVRGVQWRLSENGFDAISEQQHGQYTIRGWLTPYNKPFTRPDGAIARITGYFDYLEKQFVTLLQGGTQGSNTIPSRTFAFKENSQGQPSYTCNYDIYPEGIICANEVTYGWLNGQLSVFNSNTYNNFFGVQYDAYIVVPFNENIYDKKIFQSVTQIANKVWPCTLIYSDTNSYAAQRQESNLVTGDYKLSLDKWQASLKRDINSIGGIAGGDKLRGGLLVMKFHVQSASSFVYLSLVSVKYNEQSLTAK